MFSSKIFIPLAFLSCLAMEFNPNPSLDWDAILCGISLSAIIVGGIIGSIANIKFSRNDKMLAIAAIVITITKFESLDPYAFFLGFGICSLIPFIMMMRNPE